MGEEEEEEEEKKGESSSSWYGYGQRHFIVLAGLGGILGVTIVVMVISIVLRPAYVEFTVVDTMMKTTDQGDGLILNLAVNATTTSGRGRAKARYKSVFVDLVVASNSDSGQACDNSARNGSTTSTSSAALTLHATVDSAPATTEEDLPQSFNASLVLTEGPLVSLVEAKDTGVEFTVVVTALVSFHIGPVPTRVYHVAVRCPHVKFPSTTPVNCPH